MTKKEGKEIVRSAIAAEKARRKALDATGKAAQLPILAWSITRFAVGGDRDALDEEQASLRHWCHVFATGKAERNDPDALVFGRSYPAWPCGGSIPAWVEAQRKAAVAVWNAFAVHFQHEIDIIRNCYAEIAKREEDGTIDGQEASAQRKAVSFAGIKRLKQELPIAFAAAIAARKGKMPAPSPFVRWLAAQLPVEQLREVQERLTRLLRSTRQDRRWDQGYPRSKRDDDADWTLTLYFNGANLEMGHWLPAVTAENGSLAIGPQYDPADHHGRRGAMGGHRRDRQMRRFTLYMPPPGATKRQHDKSLNDSFALNVLIHDPSRLPSRIKGVRLSFRDGVWSLSLTVERPSEPVATVTRKFVGVDIGWRRTESEAVAVVHYATEEPGSYTASSILLHPNRKHRRWSLREGTTMTPYGTSENVRDNLREFQQEIGKRKDAMKAALTIYFQAENRMPAGWERAGKTAMRRAEVRDTEIATQLVRWLKWDAEAIDKFAFISRAVTDRKEKEYYNLAHRICNHATDIGVEDKFVAKLAKKSLTEDEKAVRMRIVPGTGKAAYSPEKHMEEEANYNRQFAAPARFIEILKWVARKRGIRIHVLDPWMTTRRCFACKHDNPATMEEEFVCAACGAKIHVDENAAMQLARLARECARGDGGARSCSHDGKSVPYHGLAGKPERNPKGGKRETGSRSQEPPQADAAD